MGVPALLRSGCYPNANPKENCGVATRHWWTPRGGGNWMAAKQLNDRNKSDRKNKKSPTRRRITTSARRRRHELIGTAMNRTKATLDAGERAFRNGAEGTNGRKVAPAKAMRRPVFRQPKTELEQAIQRYVDLFDFAPIGYVTFDRVGRIEEINFAAIRLLRRSRRQLIGTTFAICVAKEDTQLFLDHLRACRSSDGPITTELHLKQRDGENIPVQLSSTATFALMKDGARLYQTAIFDLTERNAPSKRCEIVNSVCKQLTSGRRSASAKLRRRANTLA